MSSRKNKKLHVGKQWFIIYSIKDIRPGWNKKIYTGRHKCWCLDDDYWGSGRDCSKSKLIARSGSIDHYEFIIEEYCSSERELRIKEPIWIQKNKTHCTVDKDGLNYARGGEAGFDYINENKLNNYKKTWDNFYKYVTPKIMATQKTLWETKGQKNFYYYAHTKEGLRERSLKGNKRKNELYPEGTFKGRKHKASTKRKIGLVTSITSKGVGNSQFGTMWITNNKHNIKIKKNAVIPKGYMRGRVMSASSIG